MGSERSLFILFSDRFYRDKVILDHILGYPVHFFFFISCVISFKRTQSVVGGAAKILFHRAAHHRTFTVFSDGNSAEFDL